MQTQSPQDAVIQSEADLLGLWQKLMGPGGFSTRSVWLVFLGADGRPEPVIVPIDDLPERPDTQFVRALGEIVAGLTETGEVSSVAILLSRPGARHMTDGDRNWARALAPLAARWPVHLAAAGHVQRFAPDDLVPCDAA